MSIIIRIYMLLCFLSTFNLDNFKTFSYIVKALTEIDGYSHYENLYFTAAFERENLMNDFLEQWHAR